MKDRVLESWNALLSAISHNGFGKGVIELIKEMRGTKIQQLVCHIGICALLLVHWQRGSAVDKQKHQGNASGNPTSWNTSSLIGRVHDPEEDHLHHGKKLSVLGKVKEKAKKWRQTIAKKKNGHDGNTTPSWGVALEDYEIEEEPENLGSQAYESHHAAKISKENTKQHFRAEPLITNKRDFSNDVQIHSDGDMRQKLPALKMKRTGPAMGKSLSDHQNGDTPLSGINQSPRALSAGSHLREAHPSPNKLTIDELVAQRKSYKQIEELSHPDSEVGSTDTEVIKEKEEQSNSKKSATEVVVDKSSASEEKQEPPSPKNVDEKEERFQNSIETETEDTKSKNVTKEQEELSPTTKKTISEAVSEKLAPAYASFSEATYKITSKIQGLSISSLQGNGEERKLSRGVSVKEYFKNKLEPGEDERALSQVISEVISPKRSPTEKGIVEKVRAAVTLLLQTEGPSTSTSMKRSPSQIPVSTNAHEVEEGFCKQIKSA